MTIHLPSGSTCQPVGYVAEDSKCDGSITYTELYETGGTVTKPFTIPSVAAGTRYMKPIVFDIVYDY